MNMKQYHTWIQEAKEASLFKYYYQPKHDEILFLAEVNNRQGDIGRAYGCTIEVVDLVVHYINLKESQGSQPKRHINPSSLNRRTSGLALKLRSKLTQMIRSLNNDAIDPMYNTKEHTGIEGKAMDRPVSAASESTEPVFDRHCYIHAEFTPAFLRFINDLYQFVFIPLRLVYPDGPLYSIVYYTGLVWLHTWNNQNYWNQWRAFWSLFTHPALFMASNQLYRFEVVLVAMEDRLSHPFIFYQNGMDLFIILDHLITEFGSLVDILTRYRRLVNGANENKEGRHEAKRSLRLSCTPWARKQRAMDEQSVLVTNETSMNTSCPLDPSLTGVSPDMDTKQTSLDTDWLQHLVIQ
jgi:hypothetical protein